MNPQRPRSRPSPSPSTRQRLYLFTPRLDDTADFAGALDDALGAGDVAAVLLRFAEPAAAGAAGERGLIQRIEAIAAIVHKRDIALLLDGRPDLVAGSGADGAHISGIAAFAAALGLLKPDRIAGAGGLHSRHDAMLAAEANADYVMFGEPDRDGRRPPFPALQDRLEWWAEILEIACVGYAGGMDEVGPLAATGADFIALGDWIWVDPQGAAAMVAAAGAAIDSVDKMTVPVK
jgi:thiamine-phosphate pyrophosphorylase